MEAPPLFPEAPQEDDDDSESTLAKKHAKKSESKNAKDQPKRISLENLFVREEIQESNDKKDDITEIFSRKDESSTDTSVEDVVAESVDTDQENSAEDPQLEQLDEEETRYAVESIASERTENLQQELESVNPGSSREAEVLAAAAFVENVLDHAAQGEVIDESVLDRAAHEAADDIGASLESDNIEPELGPDDETESAEDPVLSATPSGSSTTLGGSGSAPPPGGGSSFAGTGAGSPPPAGFAGSLTPAGAVGAPALPIEADSGRDERGDEHSHVKYVMAGGIVGYMLGRRRGRINTEKRLRPVQEKLEAQVENLSGQIAAREMKLRTLAREQYDRQAFDSQSVVEKLNEKNEKRSERSKSPVPLTPEQTVIAGAEHIPPSAAGAEYRRSASENSSEKTVETMKLAELLQVASMIEINGQSVKVLFESGRIDTPGLRRVIKEYMQNGDFKKELLQSMRPEIYEAPQDGMERQKTFEQRESLESNKQEERPTGKMLHNQYPQLHAADETPQLHTVYEENNATKSSDMTRKLIVGAGATVAVIILALVVGGLLLLFI